VPDGAQQPGVHPYEWVVAAWRHTERLSRWLGPVRRPLALHRAGGPVQHDQYRARAIPASKQYVLWRRHHDALVPERLPDHEPALLRAVRRVDGTTIGITYGSCAGIIGKNCPADMKTSAQYAAENGMFPDCGSPSWLGGVGASPVRLAQVTDGL